MKQSLFVGIAIFILCLSGCRNPAPEGDLPLNQTVTEEGVVLVPTETITVTPTPEPTETPVLTSTPFISVDEGEDYFVYRVAGETNYVMLYLTGQDKQFEILPDFDVRNFSLNSRQQIAYVAGHNGNLEVYVDVYPFSGKSAELILDEENTRTWVHSWSPNGQYLAITQQIDWKEKLYIWNGYIIFSIYETNELGGISDLEWSRDSRLAFTDYYGFSSKDKPSEVFVWDGMDILNVSQNPEGNDRSPAWSMDGKLAFLSTWQGELDVFVWDGKTMKGGMPDRNTYKNIAPELTFFSIPEWTNTDQLSFSDTYNPNSIESTIYLWNGYTAINISQNTENNSAAQKWAYDGYWAFYTFYSPEQIVVRKNNNQTVFTSNGVYTPAWGDNGELLFCSHVKQGDWILNLWDRKEQFEVIKGDIIYGQWMNGEAVYCTSG